ncbi:MAG: C25 family cysteine peptidase, partial [Desulfobacterales bacterium]|nr:C25 family cysteine peptidase [Desulfobacterales bacterium]
DGGGAVAVWGPTGLAFEEDLLLLDKAFFGSLFRSQEKTLGEAVLTALRTFKQNGGEPQASLIYNLLGDPSLQLRLRQRGPSVSCPLQ